jgi:hypothetical protein
VAAAAAAVGQSIKMAEAITRLERLAGRFNIKTLHLALYRSALYAALN